MAQIRELEPVLCHAGRTSQLIWTSSSNAHRSAFNLKDIQHQKGTQPYSSSKYASDLLSLALNTHYNKQVGSHTHFFFLTSDDVNNCYFCCTFQGLYSSVICPGFVMTNLTYGILPSFPAFLWTLLMPVFWLVSATLTNYWHAPAFPVSLVFLCAAMGVRRATNRNHCHIWMLLCLIISGKNVHQYFHSDPLQRSWGPGR